MLLTRRQPKYVSIIASMAGWNQNLVFADNDELCTLVVVFVVGVVVYGHAIHNLDLNSTLERSRMRGGLVLLGTSGPSPVPASGFTAR